MATQEIDNYRWMTVKEIETLRRAADYIDEVGLHKGWFTDEPRCGPISAKRGGRPVCVRGALEIVNGAEIWGYGAYSLAKWLSRRIRQVTNGQVEYLSNFNDNPETTRDDVTRFLRETADLVESKLKEESP